MEEAVNGQAATVPLAVRRFGQVLGSWCQVVTGGAWPHVKNRHKSQRRYQEMEIANEDSETACVFIGSGSVAREYERMRESVHRGYLRLLRASRAPENLTLQRVFLAALASLDEEQLSQAATLGLLSTLERLRQVCRVTWERSTPAVSSWEHCTESLDEQQLSQAVTLIYSSALERLHQEEKPSGSEIRHMEDTEWEELYQHEKYVVRQSPPPKKPWSRISSACYCNCPRSAKQDSQRQRSPRWTTWRKSSREWFAAATRSLTNSRGGAIDVIKKVGWVKQECSKGICMTPAFSLV
jgi:hypothetical protein